MSDFQSFFDTLREDLEALHPLIRMRKQTPMIPIYWKIGKALVQHFKNENLDKKARKALLGQVSAWQIMEHLGASGRLEFAFMTRLYLAFPDLDSQPLHLSMTHFRKLVAIKNHIAREYYAQQAHQFQWSVQQLIRQIKTKFFDRQVKIENSYNNPISDTTSPPLQILKEPYIFEFLDLNKEQTNIENELESALLDKIHLFLLELGNGFAFIARQQLITTPSGKRFFIDLVFYHYLLKRFILIDLKTNALTHHDLGQMDMYVRLFDAQQKSRTDHPTLGLIFCPEKDATFDEFSLLKNNPQVFAKTYSFNF